MESKQRRVSPAEKMYHDLCDALLAGGDFVVGFEEGRITLVGPHHHNSYDVPEGMANYVQNMIQGAADRGEKTGDDPPVYLYVAKGQSPDSTDVDHYRFTVE